MSNINNIQVGLIGKGYWGKILLPKLEKISNVKFVCGSKDDYKIKLDLVDWVFIATPNNTHYEIVKHCIKSGKNVFCEKPLTPTYNQSKELFKLAKKYNVKLYVDDVFNYRDETLNLHSILNKKSKINVVWEKESNNKFYDMLYHDLYLLYPLLNKTITIDWPNINNITFNYTGTSKLHTINKINFTHTKYSNDALLKMITKVLYENLNYEHNEKISLFCNKVIDKLKITLSNKNKLLYLNNDISRK